MAKLSLNTNLGKSSEAGRPARFKGLLLRQPNNSSGFEWPSSQFDSNVLQKVKDDYLTKYTMPDNLQATGIKVPDAMEQMRRRNISAGWRKPRGAA
jgi:hypothetical protein